MVAESEQVCTDAANKISEIVNQRQYRTEDPAYYFVLCSPSYYVYALFQSSLVFLSNALRKRNPYNSQAFHQSISLLKMNDDVGPAPRAVEILNMLASINGLYQDEDDNTTPSPKNNMTYVHQTETDLNAAPKSQQILHNRLMNTSIVGGITPDIQSDFGLAMSRSQPRQAQRTQTANQQIDNYTFSVYPNNHSTQHHQISHQRSFSLDQLNSTQHVYSHTRSISHDHFDLSNLHTPQPPPSHNNSMLNHNSYNPPQQMMPSFTSLPQAPQAYTAAYDPNMNVSNTTLPPSSLNWDDWNVYIGHQNQHASPSLQQQHHESSSQHHHPTF
jgi:hypothetical protein